MSNKSIALLESVSEKLKFVPWGKKRTMITAALLKFLSKSDADAIILHESKTEYEQIPKEHGGSQISSILHSELKALAKATRVSMPVILKIALKHCSVQTPVSTNQLKQKAKAINVLPIFNPAECNVYDLFLVA